MRIKQSQAEYFDNISNDRVVTILLNPILLWKGIDKMNDLDNYSGSILEDHGEKLVNEVLSPLTKKISSSNDSGAESSDGMT